MSIYVGLLKKSRGIIVSYYKRRRWVGHKEFCLETFNGELNEGFKKYARIK